MKKKTVSARSNSAIDRPTCSGMPKRDNNAARPPSTSPNPAGETGSKDNALIRGSNKNRNIKGTELPTAIAISSTLVAFIKNILYL